MSVFFLSIDPRLRTKFAGSRDALVVARRVDGCSNTLVLQCKRIFFVQPGAMPSTFSKVRKRALCFTKNGNREKASRPASCHGGSDICSAKRLHHETTSLKGSSARQQPIARRVISIDSRVKRNATHPSRAGELAKDGVLLRSAARGGARSARDQIFQLCKR